MKIKFHDNIGSKKTIYFNPEVTLFRDGSIIMLETTAYSSNKKYDLPLFAGETSCLWLDLKRCMYDNNQLHNEPGAFKVVWEENGVVNICRYKETIDETFIQKIMRFLNGIT